MRPKSMTTDLPLTHDVSTYIHNGFIKFLDELKGQIQVIIIGMPVSFRLLISKYTTSGQDHWMLS
jgi:hypothetical protein